VSYVGEKEANNSIDRDKGMLVSVSSTGFFFCLL
jgi:hypothetical protein